MRPTFTVEAMKFRVAISQLAKELSGRGIDVRKMYREEAKLFITSRSGMFNPIRTPPKTAKIGKNAITKDLHLTTSIADDGFLRFVEGNFGRTNINQSLSTKDGKPYKLEWKEISHTVAQVLAHHKSKLNNRGRPRVNRPTKTAGVWRANDQLITSPKVFKKALKTLHSRVGTAKGGYVAALRGLGVSFPRWINRPWSSQTGSYREEFDASRANLQIQTSSTKIPGYEKRAKEAMLARAKTIEGKTRRLISGKAVNLGFISIP